MSNQWPNNLRKRMETHQEPSPEGLWEDIERIMQQESSIAIPPKQNKILLWSKRIGAIAAVILVILLIRNYLMIENSQKLQIITQKKQTPHEHKNNLSTDQENGSEFITGNRSNRVFSYAKRNIAVSVPKESLYSKDESSLIAKVEEKEEHKAESERENSHSESNIEKKTYDSRPSSKKRNQDNKKAIDQNTYSPVIERKNKYTKWEASVYGSNISSNSAKKNEGYGSFVSGGVLPEGTDEDLILGEDPQSDIFIQNKYREVYTDIKHRQPIIIGVSANYNIDDKWSLISGLTYTILSSQLRSGSDSYYYTSKQTLHNIGIPLNINYNVWKSKKVSIYLSAGGLVEKNVSGNLTTDYIIDDQLKSSQEDKISIDQLQWSINAAVGVQYNLSQKVGLYAEPGVSYYFKNGSEVETIYKEKPLNLSLRFGLRFSLNK